ncbi:MAG: hypothetical protein JXQ91_01205 [Vannielia sp.]|uniref:hypothetical protein n=1 Tax=Rhodobacterales TaxID=204455 RepID=UPI002095023A|nr:hypothetical protein [Oceanicola sp. 502str15]MCO6382454.1 hypothetical protein [Oceanicola sp. 502str15]
MSINASTPLGVMSFFFITLCQKDKHFPAELSRRLPQLSPLLAIRIGAILDNCAFHGIIRRDAVTWSIGGSYPSNLTIGQSSMQQVANDVRFGLKPLRIDVSLQEAMKTCQSITNDAMMLGIGKITDAMDGTLANLSAVYKDGKKYWTYGGKPLIEKGPVLTELNKKIINYDGNLVDLFILAI